MASVVLRERERRDSYHGQLLSLAVQCMGGRDQDRAGDQEERELLLECAAAHSRR